MAISAITRAEFETLLVAAINDILSGDWAGARKNALAASAMFKLGGLYGSMSVGGQSFTYDVMLSEVMEMIESVEADEDARAGNSFLFATFQTMRQAPGGDR